MKFKLMLAAGCFLAGVTATHAQVGGVKVQVPFEFEMANMTLPAGEYVVWSEHDQVLLRVAGGKTVAMTQANRTMHDGGKSGQVVFNCYDKRCFLSKLWTPDAEQGRELLMSKTEKQLAKHGEPQLFALLGKAPERNLRK